MAVKILPSTEELRELFEYNTDLGLLYWKPRTVKRCGHINTAAHFNSNHAGNQVGYKNAHGYIEVTIGPKYYSAHRIIWKIVTGIEPPAVIDHINQIRDDNRWCNLRESDPRKNTSNSKVSGNILPRGVYKNSDGTFTARAKVTTTIQLGTYATEVEAQIAYNNYRGV